MALFKKNEQEIDIKKVNDVVSLSKRILEIAYILVIALAIYVCIKLTQELSILEFLLTILKIISPLFIGILIAWLLNPFVLYLQKKGMRRGFGAAVSYILLIGFLTITIWSVIPTLSEQINDFANMIPGLFETIKGWIDTLFDGLDNIKGFDAMALKKDLFLSIEEIGTNLTSSLPAMVVGFVTSLFSGIGTFIVGLIIGFYLILGMDDAFDNLVGLLPKRMQGTTKELLGKIDGSLRSFVQGAVIDSMFVFIITAIGFSLVGLRAPLFFALFCGITNVIPYAGPYIGGFPAVIVGLSQGIPTGIFTLLVVVLIQFLEGNFLQPLIMSKTTKLHPVTIMLGLLIFGYFWGIIGMVLSTPIIAATKAIIVYLDEKYDFLSYND